MCALGSATAMRQCVSPSRRQLIVPHPCRRPRIPRSLSAISKFNLSRVTDAMKHSECTANRTALRRVLLILGLFAATAAQAQLKIEVSSGVTDPIPIAIVPFAHTPTDGGFDVAAVVQNDLEGSGRFRAMPRARMHTNPARVENVEQADWRADGNDYVAVGRLTPLPTGELAVDFDLVNVLNGQRLGSERFTAGVNALRNAAHRG